MNIDEMINGWTFEETIKTTENLMEVEKNMFTWDVIRHLRDFLELYIEQLKEYEDLEGQGLLLRFPCKVGDTVYCIEDKKIWDCIVDKVTISRINGVWIEVKAPKSMPDISAIEYTENAFGKTVFLTKSEAEAKLKELRGEQNDRE